MVTRTNRYTGQPYTDDPTIMSWQIGNEPRAFSPKTRSCSANGCPGPQRLSKVSIRTTSSPQAAKAKQAVKATLHWAEQLHADPNVDYMTIHIWPLNWGWVTPEELGGERLEQAVANTRPTSTSTWK